MTLWRFYQGVRGEWRWYAFDQCGRLHTSADRGFEQLSACMENAATAGFAGGSYQVTTRLPEHDVPAPVIAEIITRDAHEATTTQAPPCENVRVRMI